MFRGYPCGADQSRRFRACLCRSCAATHDPGGITGKPRPHVKALGKLSQQVAEGLLRAHETWDRDAALAGIVASAALTGSPSLLDWPNLSLEDYDRMLRRALARRLLPSQS
jgi:hypothetical protein